MAAHHIRPGKGRGLKPPPFRDPSRPGFAGAPVWQTPLTDDYEQGCAVGQAYAAYFVQFLRDNPCLAGLNRLGDRAVDAGLIQADGVRGCWIGFFSHRERVLAGEVRS